MSKGTRNYSIFIESSSMFAQRKQQTTKLYHGVSAMAMKGLVDMGDGSFSGGSSQAFSQLPTQSVRRLLLPPTLP